MKEYPPAAALTGGDADDPSGSKLRTAFVREAIVQYRGHRLKVEAPIRQADQAVDLARRVVRDESREHFMAIYLDARHRPIAHSVVSVGTATASLVHPREVFQTAVLSGAAALLVLHNHPSGDVRPSAEDRAVTQRLADAGTILGIRLVDSIVWTHGGRARTSFHEIEPDLFAALRKDAGASVASRGSQPRPGPTLSID